MFLWVLYCIFDVLFNVVCYITNPIVVLFGNEYGNLPWLLTWWDNYDDCMDVEWFIKEGHVPSWCVYDYDKHYKFHDSDEALQTRGTYKSYVDILDPNFTLKERLQRYACRVLWLYRNCAYGFSYYVTGRDVDGSQLIDKSRLVLGQKLTIKYYKNWKTTGPFVVYGMIRWNPKNIKWLQWTKVDRKFILKIFLGWKCHSVGLNEVSRCMLALFVWPFK